jgi:nucleolin
MAKAAKSKKSETTPKHAPAVKKTAEAKTPAKSRKKDTGEEEESGKDALSMDAKGKTPKVPAPSKKKSRDDEDEEGEDEEVDDWEKPEEEDNWDPDFDEFDIPKSRAKKSGGKKDDDDFAIDDEFKDMGMFDDSGGYDDDDDF